MSLRKNLGVLTFGALVAACSGGGGSGGGYCVGTFAGGTTSFDCTNCSGVNVFDDNPFAPAIDNDGGTFRQFGLGTGGGSIAITIEAPAGMSFPAGVDAGALIRFPAGTPVSASYSLFNGTTPVAATSGSTIAAGAPPPGAGTPTYYPVVPSATIDRIDIAISASGNGSNVTFDLHEVCGDL